ncbi:hypothetical protein [Bradyrhizobium sp. NP1]|uniref:hypothetical protein n=1 Tax=Bradyrhizobium sp. NP1 TaxID=3049772 RepID=UPI0025A58BFD|nr:hypothetical protein [Bradyrhizobium sp. NP1]WJR80450.1 hypothetical protein QOU61_12040 [Bradyrhizobium sp. NP1]
MRVTILGGGFGLYGYLPAVLGLGADVVLAERYRSIVARRVELAPLATRVSWAVDEREAVAGAAAVIVARRPVDQADLIAELLAKPNVRRLLLEKPLAPGPDAAMRLQDQLEASGRIVRVGYTFPFTGWGRDLVARPGASRDDIGMRWTFRAHHYATKQANWKRLHSEGGGALRFYGIQLIGLLARLGFDRVEASAIAASDPDEAEDWRATITAGGGARCTVELRSRAEPAEFAVTAPATGIRLSRSDPFDDPVGADGFDRRVPVLSALCREWLGADASPQHWYRDTIALWKAIEAVTVRG